MSKNILHILSDVLTAAVNQINAAIEADEAEAAAVENAPQEAAEATEQEAAPVETMEAETAAPVETMEAETAAPVEVIAAEVDNATKNKPNDFDERLKKAMEILKGRI